MSKKEKVELTTTIPSDPVERARVYSQVQRITDLMLQIESLKDQISIIVDDEKEKNYKPSVVRKWAKILYDRLYGNGNVVKALEEGPDMVSDVEILSNSSANVKND